MSALLRRLGDHMLCRGEAFRLQRPPVSWLLARTAAGRRVLEKASHALGRDAGPDDDDETVLLRRRLKAARVARSDGTALEQAMTSRLDAGSLQILARHLIADRRYDECEALLARAPPTAATGRMMLRLALARGRVPAPETIAACRRLIDLPLAAAGIAARQGPGAALAFMRARRRWWRRSALVDFLTGHVAVFAGCEREAIDRLSKVLRNDPAFGEALAMRGLAREREGMIDAAIDDYRSAMASPFRPERWSPSEPGLAIPSRSNTMFRLVALLVSLGCQEEARRLLLASPSPFATARAGRLGLRRWDGHGEDPGRLLIMHRRGIGDEIRALAGLRLVRGRGVGWIGDPRLAPLVAARPDVRFFARNVEKGFDAGDFDSVADGEYLARLATVEASLEPAFAPAADACPGWARPRRIALSWRSLVCGLDRGAHDFGMEGVRAFGAGAIKAGLEIIVLQAGVRPDELAALGAPAPDIDLVQDLAGAAGLLRSCDACIATPSSVCELAASIGLPTVQAIRFRAGFTTWRFDDSGHDRLTPNLTSIVAASGETEAAFARRAINSVFDRMGTRKGNLDAS